MKSNPVRQMGALVAALGLCALAGIPAAQAQETMTAQTLIDRQMILDQIIAEYQQHDSYSAAMIGAYLFQFAVLLQRALRQHGAGASPADQAHVAELRRLLDQHIASEAPIRELARQAHMSESHFSHQVKALLGVAPKTYVREQRIARARELLHSTALSVEEIAAALGYDEPTSFFRAFKRATGVTPGEFRRGVV